MRAIDLLPLPSTSAAVIRHAPTTVRRRRDDDARILFPRRRHVPEPLARCHRRKTFSAVSCADAWGAPSATGRRFAKLHQMGYSRRAGAARRGRRRRAHDGILSLVSALCRPLLLPMSAMIGQNIRAPPMITASGRREGYSRRCRLPCHDFASPASRHMIRARRFRRAARRLCARRKRRGAAGL